jgi:hypothetical protein
MWCSFLGRQAWRSCFERALDGTDLDLSQGPLWRVQVLRDPSGRRMAWVAAFNHAISDQVSVNIVVHEVSARHA